MYGEQLKTKVRELIKIVREEQVKCGTFTLNAWSLAGGVCESSSCVFYL